MSRCFHVNYGTHEEPGVRCASEVVKGKDLCAKHLKPDAGNKYKIGETVQHQVGRSK